MGAAAADLAKAQAPLAAAFAKKTSVAIRWITGSSGVLAQQAEHGAPYDVFAAADTEHIDELARKGFTIAGTRAIYARGRLVLWVPNPRVPVERIEDLLHHDVTHIAIANPRLAPYGRAAEESLRGAHLWETVQPRIVFAENVSMATQYAASGNADVAFTALALVYDRPGRKIEIPESLHAPIDQAIAVIRGTSKVDLARKFVDFVTGAAAKQVLQRYGYSN